jgi:hypothetical protein
MPAQAAEQRVRTDCKTEGTRKARTGFPSDGEADQLQRGIQPHRLSGVMRYDSRKSFAEDAPRTEAVRAAEAARVQFEFNRDAVPRKVRYGANVAAVDASRSPITARAQSPRGRGLDNQRDRAKRWTDAVEADGAGVGEQGIRAHRWG